jgi:hypothetical protein
MNDEVAQPSSFEEWEASLNAKLPMLNRTQSAMPLPRWYEKVRTKLVSELSVEDLCIACRQKIFLVGIVPEALGRLRRDPAAGEKYDWELLYAISSISKKYWEEHEDQRLVVLEIARKSVASMGVKTRNEIESLISRLNEN